MAEAADIGHITSKNAICVSHYLKSFLPVSSFSLTRLEEEARTTGKASPQKGERGLQQVPEQPHQQRHLQRSNPTYMCQCKSLKNKIKIENHGHIILHPKTKRKSRTGERNQHSENHTIMVLNALKSGYSLYGAHSNVLPQN